MHKEERNRVVQQQKTSLYFHMKHTVYTICVGMSSKTKCLALFGPVWAGFKRLAIWYMSQLFAVLVLGQVMSDENW